MPLLRFPPIIKGMSVVDQYSDPVMANLAKRVSDRPKLASTIGNFDVDSNEREGLPDSAFAWPEKRAYPVHTREHAMLSRIYREGETGVPAHVDRTLKEACDIYDIDDALFARPKKASVKASRADYLLPRTRDMRVSSAEEVKVAEAQLRSKARTLSVTDRASANRRLVEKAAQYGVKVRPEAHKAAGFTVTDRQPLLDWIEARKEAAPAAHKAHFDKLASAVKRLPLELRERDTQIKLAEALVELDKRAGLSKHYGRKLLDPMDTVFNTTKLAEDGVTLAGTFVPTARLVAQPSTFYADILGPDIVREVVDPASGELDPAALSAILPTLPIDIQRTLVSYIR